MRQAGRYLPEYRELRARSGFLETCRDPDLAAEVSVQPYRRFGMDAVIVFSDILMPLADLGLGLEFAPGPTVHNPLLRPGDLSRLAGDVSEVVAPTCEAIRRIRTEVGEEVPIIGFAGAPWTLAAYSTEEKLSRDTLRVRTLVYDNPAFLQDLLDRLSDITAETLRLQAEAGANVLQIFDTWAGLLSAETFRRFAGRAIARVLEGLPSDRPPVILFARGASHLLEDLAALGPDVVSVDWRVHLSDAVARIGQTLSLQGNLDPVTLHADSSTIQSRTREIVESGRKARGHIVNLGHGVYPTTPIEGVAAFG
jgi:uroporphyrinogen decarboxylase